MDYIITIPIADDVWTEEVPRPQPSARMADNGTDVAYLTTNNTGWPASMSVAGGWDEYTGEPLIPFDQVYFDWIRPLGNDDGVATGVLDSMKWQGHSSPKYVQYDDTDPEDIQASRYPDYQSPFSLQIERTFITDDGFPQIPHGWKVTMLSDDPLRDITARAIGIYNDAGAYLYTTGAFIDDGTGTYFTECPVGQRTADEVQINFKLLLGSAPEGAWVLPVGKDGDVREFWATDQGGGAWVDSGATTNGMAGTVTLVVPDNSVFSGGQTVRIDGDEYTITSLWTTGGINLDPYVALASGLTVEVQS